jgi:hypothetical protein
MMKNGDTGTIEVNGQTLRATVVSVHPNGLVDMVVEETDGSLRNAIVAASDFTPDAAG